MEPKIQYAIFRCYGDYWDVLNNLFFDEDELHIAWAKLLELRKKFPYTYELRRRSYIHVETPWEVVK